MPKKGKEKRRPASFFIDYENVRGAGLDGVETLAKGDQVVVLYGSKDSALKLEAVQHVLDSPAKVQFIKVATGKHDALDFQLVALMFMQMKKKRDYYIVSRDTGFDFAIRMAKERGFDHVYRRETISGITLEQKKLPSGRRGRTKRLPQPQEATAALENVPEAAANQQPAEKQPAKRSRKRGGRRRGTPGAATPADPAAPADSTAPEAPATPARSEAPAIPAAPAAPDGLAASAESPKEPAAIPAPEPVVEPLTEEAAEPTAETAAAPAVTPAEATEPQPARKPRRRSRRSAPSPKPAENPYRSAIENVLAQHLGTQPEAAHVDVVMAALGACETKSRFYNFLRGNMGNEQGLAFYREVKGCFEQLRAIERPAASEQ